MHYPSAVRSLFLQTIPPLLHFAEKVKSIMAEVSNQLKDVKACVEGENDVPSSSYALHCPLHPRRHSSFFQMCRPHPPHNVI